MSHIVACNVAVLAIAAIYYAWRDLDVAARRRKAKQNERVALMLWAVAQKTA